MESVCTTANAHVTLGYSLPFVSSPKGIKFPFAECRKIAACRSKSVKIREIKV